MPELKPLVATPRPSPGNDLGGHVPLVVSLSNHRADNRLAARAFTFASCVVPEDG